MFYCTIDLLALRQSWWFFSVFSLMTLLNCVDQIHVHDMYSSLEQTSVLYISLTKTFGVLCSKLLLRHLKTVLALFTIVLIW